MEKEELAAMVEALAQEVGERATGNEENEILAERMDGLVRTERPAVLALLRDSLSLRIPQSERGPESGLLEGRMWFALEMARRYSLTELRSDIERLISDVRAGKAFLPYYSEMISRYLPGLIQ